MACGKTARHQDGPPHYLLGGLLPRTHGSSLFTRGETQAIGATTLGGATDAQKVDGLGNDKDRRFYLHYFFPPSSVGETGRVGAAVAGRWATGTSRRGRSCRSSPPYDDPFTVRLESTITESNGARRWRRCAPVRSRCKTRGCQSHGESRPRITLDSASRSLRPLSLTRRSSLSFARVASKRPSPVLKNAFRLARLGGYGKRSSHNRAIFTRHPVELSTGTPPGSVACEIGALGRDVRVAVNRCPLSRDVRRFSRLIFFPPTLGPAFAASTFRPESSRSRTNPRIDVRLRFAGKSRASPWVSSSATSPRAKLP